MWSGGYRISDFRTISFHPPCLRVQNGTYNKYVIDSWLLGRDPFNQNSNRSDREKRTNSKGGPVFSKLFRLDRTDPLGFGPKFPEILVEWIAPLDLELCHAECHVFEHVICNWTCDFVHDLRSIRFETEELFLRRFGIRHVFSWICQIFVGIWGPLKEKTKNL